MIFQTVDVKGQRYTSARALKELMFVETDIFHHSDRAAVYKLRIVYFLICIVGNKEDDC